MSSQIEKKKKYLDVNLKVNGKIVKTVVEILF